MSHARSARRRVDVVIDLAGLFVLYAVSRALAWHAGVVFDLKAIDTSWQLLDPALLRHDLLASVAHMPGQPPLYNLFVGALLQIGDLAGLSPSGVARLFRGVYTALALGAIALCYDLFRVARCRRATAIIVTALFACSPAFLLFEAEPYYTLMVLVWLLLAARAFMACIDRPNGWRAGGFFLALAGLIATRSLFQIEWFALLGTLLILACPGARARIAWAGVVPLVLVLALYAKNVVLIGEFSTSDWMGLSLAKLTTLALPSEQRATLVAEGRLSSFALTERAYDLSRADIARLRGPPGTDRAVLRDLVKSDGSINYNALRFAQLSRIETRDALATIRAAPAVYARSVATAWLMFFRPAADYPLVADNRAAIAPWARFNARFIAGQPVYHEHPAFKLQPGTVGRFIVIGYLLAVFYGAWVLVRCLRQRRIDALDALLLFCWLNALYVGVIGNALEIDENQRFRFAIEPFVALLDVVALRVIVGYFTPGPRRRGWYGRAGSAAPDRAR